MLRLGPTLAALGFASIALAASVTASAHDQWLEAEPFTSPTPGREKIYLFSGDRFASPTPVVVKNRALYTRFFVQSSAGRRDILANMREDDQPIAMLTSGAATGSFLIALDGVPHTLELGADKFAEYLLEERFIDVLTYRMQSGTEDAPGRERYTRCLKTLIQIGPKLEPLVTKPVGQAIEIVPEEHPYSVAIGGQLGVRVIFLGQPLAGRAITAVNRYRGEIAKQTVRLDAKGHATFVLSRAGDWMIRVVHMTKSAEPDVDWRSYWSNFTFSLPDLPRSVPAPTAAPR